ncbi:MAG: succinylglutamate desuccinylase/aspartoacylase family protein, partial [Pseudomonadota bacterium]|nr:succinylglutamate desuccinylase/aspartoacylase family protein [Pseudomonadota bacterium]
PMRANRSQWVRAPRGGVSRRVRKSGDIVRQGNLLAVVGGLFGEDGIELVSPIDGVIIGHATLPVVNQGDALFHIAEVGALDHAGENAHSIVEAMAVSDPPFPASPILDEDELL